MHAHRGCRNPAATRPPDAFAVGIAIALFEQQQRRAVSRSGTNKATAILAVYWRRHPAACDTPEGMQRWWMGGRTDVSVADVEQALREMIESELVECRKTGERSIYRLRADADPAALLRLSGSAPP
jgi:hypothetical protein